MEERWCRLLGVFGVGCEVCGAGCWALGVFGVECWVLGVGCWVLGVGCLGVGCCVFLGVFECFWGVFPVQGVPTE